ncbi:DUF2563 family protein [Mycolicibacterium sp. XJ1904]
MFVDTDLLRMGADFAKSAGEIVKRGADEFVAASLPSGIFGDFDTAHDFYSALGRAHEAHAATMRLHHSDLEGFAAKATDGATLFDERDRGGAAAVRAAGEPIA